MESSKLTPELSQALDRAMTAAASDPLVEALEALQKIVRSLDWEERRSGTTYIGHEEARAVLAKYRPEVSDSDTLKS